MSVKKQNINIYVCILSTLTISVLLLAIFTNIYNFSSSQAYQEVVIGFDIFDIIALILISLCEILSFKFDRTASKDTTVATIFLFASFLVSKDFLLMFSHFGVLDENIFRIINNVFLYLFNVFYFGFFIFIFRFYQNIYNLKSFTKIQILSCLIMVMLFSIFNAFNIWIGALIIIILEVLYSLAFSIYYLWKIRDRANFSSGLIAFYICTSLSLSLLFDFLSTKYNFTGLSDFAFAITSICYFMIYGDFLIGKLGKLYVHEDIELEKKKQLSHTMKVTCFHCFNCYYDDINLEFPSKKAKEFFALLVILQGKTLTMDKAITYLYPDKDIEKAKTSYRDIVWKLRKFFKEIGFNSITFKRGETCLDISNIECDYYEAIKDPTKYNGDPLMPEYDWSIEFENDLNTH